MKTSPMQALYKSRLYGLCLFVLVGLLTTSHLQAANLLAHATSPYLLQHAEDAIHWQPWSEAALKQAKQEDKLIFLSIGYSSCHWCHKMARDTFTDAQVIAYLNDHYVTILVDREQRPDLDSTYLQVAQAMNGEAGWPLNVVLTPQQLPLFASSYLPPQPRFGLTGLYPVLQGINTAWKQDRDVLLRDETLIRRQLQELLAPSYGDHGDKGDQSATSPAESQGGEDPRDRAVRHWMARFDTKYGGFGESAKFLHPEVLSLLLRQAVTKGDAALSNAVFFTLEQMAAGGVRDQLGGAFHRYSADRFWQVPHFEIMLYDNALMARVYMEAWQLSRKPLFAFVAQQILDDLLKRFQLPSGGFAAALDADTLDANGEHHEGLYYTWTADEIMAQLGTQKSCPLLKAFVERQRGTLDGRAILRLQTAPELLLEQHNKLAPLLLSLRQARQARPAPYRDEKVITSWNGLVVSALAQAARLFEEPRYRQAAQAGVKYLLQQPWKDGKLRHVRYGQQVGEVVFLEDYGFLLQSLLDLYETDFNREHLQQARLLAAQLWQRFQKKAGQALQRLPVDHVEAGINPVPLLNQQGVPSGNAVALTALARLALLLWDDDLQERVTTIMQGLRSFLLTEGYQAPELLRALAFQAKSAQEIVFVGPLNDKTSRKLLQAVQQRLLPGTVMAWVEPSHRPDPKQWPLLAHRPMVDHKPTVYVCVNALCKQPVTETEALLPLLQPVIVQPPIGLLSR